MYTIKLYQKKVVEKCSFNELKIEIVYSESNQNFLH